MCVLCACVCSLSVHDLQLCVQLGMTAQIHLNLFLSILLLRSLILQDGQTALFIASRKGHDEVVKILLRAKADLNLQANVSSCTYQNCPL